jgi:hypothetical protein
MATMIITDENENLIRYYLREVGDLLPDQTKAEQLWQRMDEAWPHSMTEPAVAFAEAPVEQVEKRRQLASELPSLAADVGLDLPGRVRFNRGSGGLGLGDACVYVLTETGYEHEGRTEDAMAEIADAEPIEVKQTAYEIRFSDHPHGGEYYEPQNQRGLSEAAAADLSRLRDAVHRQLCGDPPKPSAYTTGVSVACDTWGSGAAMARVNGRWHVVHFQESDFPALAEAIQFEHPGDDEP